MIHSFRKLGLVIVIALLVLITVPAIVNFATVTILAKRYPPLGKIFIVDGRRMHLYCVGSAAPTILLEAGSGDDLLYWQTVQPELSRTSRVCSYDRSGLGWSESRSGEHDAGAIARELHELLDVAAVQRPLVLVGASGGAYYVREYAREHPDEVTGVALLDGSSPQQLDELPNSRSWFEAERKRRWRATRWGKLETWLGWERLVGRCNPDVPPSLSRFHSNYAAEACRPEYADGDLPEWSEFDVSAGEAARLTTFGRVPLLVMSQDPDRQKAGWTADQIAAQPIWSREQDLLKNLSLRSWRVIARSSGHHIHLERPELVIREISYLVSCSRGEMCPVFGSTIVQ